ncbi:hypothetical protein [Nocardia sp. NPDC052566]|uniref:hypothetical protein n=1 Tax=Nocardia sp. NPDC052566 TaxID=3364330 RepID=UPI0037C9D878
MDAPQPISTGLSPVELHRLCRRGVWRRLRDHPGAALSAEGRHLLLVLEVAETMADTDVASHCSATVLLGLPGWSARLGRVHLTRITTNGGFMSRHVVVHSARIEPDEIQTVNGIPVTTPPRTVIDIARWEGFEHAVVVGDAALNRGLTTSAELREHLRRAEHRPGYRKAERVVGFLDGRSASVGESRSRVAIHRGGLPAPELHAHVFAAGGAHLGQVDFLFAELGVIGEFDRAGLDQNGLPRIGADPIVKIPEAALRALGWCVVRWSWDDLDEPDELIHRLRAAAERAGHLRRTGHWRASPKT